LLLDKQDLAKAGLQHILSNTDAEIVSGISTQTQIREALARHHPDLLILDPGRVDGFSLPELVRLKAEFPSVSTLVISSTLDRENVLATLESGVSAYLTKDCSQDEILMAVQAALRGEKFFCHTVLDILLDNRIRRDEPENQSSLLTEREVQIIKLIAEGNSTLKIAQELNLSHHTINSHRKNILRKLKIKSPAELVIYAIDAGLIHPKW
jgi:two-component system, NarL family, invasion response regulator UvrY